MLPSLLLIWAKLTVALTCTSVPLKLYTSVFGCGCGFGFEQKFWRIDGFAYAYSPPSFNILSSLYFSAEGSIATL